MSQNFNQNPYLYILIFALIIFILFIIRYLLIFKIKRQDVLVGNAQYIGKRKEQEDSFSTLINDNGLLAVLADGMGGFSNGKMASSIAVDTFVSEFSKLSDIQPIENFFVHASRMSNSKILEKAKGIKTGTTLATVIITEGSLYWASIGDSAIILFRNGQFINLNKKHLFEMVLEERYISGKISREELMNNSKKKRLTSYVGNNSFKDIEISPNAINLKPGDKVLLCSDGVYNSISELDMEKILMKNIVPFNAAEEIIEFIKNKNIKNQDNATIVILEKNH